MAADNRISRIRDKLLDVPEPVEDVGSLRPDWKPQVPIEVPPVEASVLIALMRRGSDFSVLYTQRSADLRSHSGQVAFPGGKLDPDDQDAAAAALREADEEVGIDPKSAEILGYLPHYYTGTNYLITPVVAVVEPPKEFVLNPLEVESVFEVPLPLIARDESYGTYHIQRGNIHHQTWQIDHDGHLIWGITANLTRRFKDTALHGDEDW